MNSYMHIYVCYVPYIVAASHLFGSKAFFSLVILVFITYAGYIFSVSWRQYKIRTNVGPRETNFCYYYL